MLFIFAMMTLIFVAILTGVYLKTYLWCAADQFEQPQSLYQDILDLAEEINRVMGIDARDATAQGLDRSMRADTTAIQFDVDAPCRGGKKPKRRKTDATEDTILIEYSK
jgi:hypothetical protein